jgi:hypothetical protein
VAFKKFVIRFFLALSTVHLLKKEQQCMYNVTEALRETIVAMEKQ